jgi:GNAT superfamily N-acetyltransferase
MTTRPARLADAPAIAVLTGQLGYDATVAQVTERLARLLARPDMFVAVAEQAGQIAGWVHVEIAEYVESEPFAVIGGLVVDRTHRRQGIGAALMADAETWARARGCGLMRLWSTTTRAPAHRFYAGLGYTNVKTQYSFVKVLDPRAAGAGQRLVPRVDPEAS